MDSAVSRTVQSNTSRSRRDGALRGRQGFQSQEKCVRGAFESAVACFGTVLWRCLGFSLRPAFDRAPAATRRGKRAGAVDEGGRALDSSRRIPTTGEAEPARPAGGVRARRRTSPAPDPRRPRRYPSCGSKAPEQRSVLFEVLRGGASRCSNVCQSVGNDSRAHAAARSALCRASTRSATARALPSAASLSQPPPATQSPHRYTPGDPSARRRSVRP